MFQYSQGVTDNLNETKTRCRAREREITSMQDFKRHRDSERKRPKQNERKQFERDRLRQTDSKAKRFTKKKVG